MLQSIKASGLASVITMILTGAAVASEPVAERVIVTATKKSRPPAETGSQVTLITREEIERKGAVFVTDVLRDVPGVGVSQNGGPGGFAAVRLRGEEQYRTLLIVDGLKLSDPSGTQTSFNFANLLARDVERIEILRGPQALLYGADAIGGVIVITTRRGSEKTEAGLSIEAGSFETITGSASVRGRSGIVDYAVTVSGFDNEGITAQIDSGNTEPDPYRNVMVHGVFGAALSPNWRLEGVARYSEAEAQFDRFDFVLLTSDTDNVLYTEQFAGRLALSGQSGDGRLSGNVAASYMAQNRADYANGAPFIFGSRFDSERTRIEALGRYQVAAGHDVVLGTDFEDERATTDALNRGRTILGALAEYQGRLTPETFVTLGARYDDHEEFGDHVSWRATLSHGLVKTETMGLMLKASAGTGFRAPSLFELCDGFSGNPALREERGTGWDAGVDLAWPEANVEASFAYFDQRVEDEIRFDPNIFVYIQNAVTTRSTGVEASLGARLLPDLRVQLAYTYTDATISSVDAEDGLPRQRRPQHLGSVSVDWSFADGRGNLNATLQTAAKQEDGFFIFRTELDDRAIVNLNARYRLNEHVLLNLRGQNVFDERYSDAVGFSAPRAGLFAGVALDW